jgi:hypothetical protein
MDASIQVDPEQFTGAALEAYIRDVRISPLDEYASRVISPGVAIGVVGE